MLASNKTAFSPKGKCFQKPSPLLSSVVECIPFGYTCSCNAGSFLELVTLVKTCQAHLPFVSLSTLSHTTDQSEYQHALDQHFHLRHTHNGRLYADFEAQSKRLNEAAFKLSTAPVLHHNFVSCANFHVSLLSDHQALVVVGNLRLLLRCIHNKQVSLYNDWCKVLDDCPERTEQILRSLMNEAGHFLDHRWDKVSPISFSDFSTLGVGKWLNDEIINYFVQKWCSSAGTTLGLTTFFACKFLFQDDSCVNAKTGTLSLTDEKEVLKWCKKRQGALGLEFWDSVFIPIHESSSHWYSAYIDFRLKRIEIYDSLQETCLTNRRKPVLLRKNAKLMLVLMWLTEVLGRMRGEVVYLNQNGTTDWVFDPHSKVHFQPNVYDCGVHTLWHLQHVLEFRQICLGRTCCSEWLSFTDNMVGKRMRLAQEILQDCE
ncbi:hypothetical protein D9757_010090 [Collybiopsis confluens]|uniref:Ubiquitin-like protease family profile domain-containing protein n=1 Tax=Collybiopsis confluens TaxID=2823264 RepID=A0A8H5GLW1_9AGAR|nr:hypothetical protein D9757_010090 [Collybiopsis confluens]